VDAKSTFFVLGWIARRYPGLVRRMADEGHEVASHSDVHRRLYQLSPDDLAADLARARDSLEQITGTRVWGLRAPVFSIDERVLDCLAAAGYWYDSSFYAFGAHDRYGELRCVPDPDAAVVRVRPDLVELPMSRLVLGPMAAVGGRQLLRLIPYPCSAGACVGGWPRATGSCSLPSLGAGRGRGPAGPPAPAAALPGVRGAIAHAPRPRAPPGRVRIDADRRRPPGGRAPAPRVGVAAARHAGSVRPGYIGTKAFSGHELRHPDVRTVPARLGAVRTDRESSR
jgi:hypothetical protein